MLIMFSSSRPNLSEINPQESWIIIWNVMQMEQAQLEVEETQIR